MRGLAAGMAPVGMAALYGPEGANGIVNLPVSGMDPEPPVWLTNPTHVPRCISRPEYVTFLNQDSDLDRLPVKQ